MHVNTRRVGDYAFVKYMKICSPRGDVNLIAD